MRFTALLSTTLAVSAFALPALAQSAVPAMPAPTRSETAAAQPEWYRQFAQSTPSSSLPAWQAEPVDDFSVVIGKDQRWQLSFDKLSRPAQTMLPREQVQAGATFRITPRFSVGGEVSVGAEELDRLEQKNAWDEQNVEAGIRLKSAFKF